MENKTIKEFDTAIGKCKDIFTAKVKDYGLAWRILRPSSITDQIYIKAKRIRSIEEKKIALVQEGVDQEYIAMVNYSIMGLIQLELGYDEHLDENSADQIIEMYEKHVRTTKELMCNKNHDYDEAWRQMAITSITDIILMKLLRIKQIEKNNGNTIISEGINANYQDIINYSIFALIRLSE